MKSIEKYFLQDAIVGIAVKLQADREIMVLIQNAVRKIIPSAIDSLVSVRSMGTELKIIVSGQATLTRLKNIDTILLDNLKSNGVEFNKLSFKLQIQRLKNKELSPIRILSPIGKSILEDMNLKLSRH